MFRRDLCTVCGECLSQCYYMDIQGNESLREFRKLIDGEPSRVVSECVSCMGCSEACPEKADPFSLILRRQEETGEFDRFGNARSAMEGAYGVPTTIHKGSECGPVIDLCAVSTTIPGLFEGALFEGATFLAGGDYFCGIGFYHLGMAGPVEDNAASVVERIAQAGSEKVICYHDDCYTFFEAIAPSLGVPVPFVPVSWPEFLYHRMLELTDRVKPINNVVAYQRPCASRHTPEKDHYVDEIFDLVGVRKPPRTYEGLQSLCCGSAIVPRDWEMADRIKHRNLADARDAGAEIVVTLCPLCLMNLRKRAPAHGLSVVAISDLCRAALGEIPL